MRLLKIHEKKKIFAFLRDQITKNIPYFYPTFEGLVKNYLTVVSLEIKFKYLDKDEQLGPVLFFEFSKCSSNEMSSLPFPTRFG